MNRMTFRYYRALKATLEKQLKEEFILYGNPAVAIWCEIKDNGGFDNINHWDQKKVAEWVKANYKCTMKVAMEVAEVI